MLKWNTRANEADLLADERDSFGAVVDPTVSAAAAPANQSRPSPFCSLRLVVASLHSVFSFLLQRLVKIERSLRRKSLL